MRIRWLFSVLAVLAGTLPLAAQSAGAYAQKPIVFEPNRGQAPPAIQFLSRGNGYGLYLTETEAVLSLVRPEPVLVRMTLAGQNPRPRIEGMELQQSVSNYLRGNSDADWRNSIPHFARVRYRSVYPGIDLIYYGHDGQLEYDFRIEPNVDPNIIELEFSGIENLSIDGEGHLVLHTGAGEIRHQRPVAYQEREGRRTPVDAEYVLRGPNRAAFALGAYDSGSPLVVDPKLVWSSYLGGTSYDSGYDLALDTDGNAYITGYTLSADFWGINPIQPALNGLMDAFISKIDSSGAIVYSTRKYLHHRIHAFHGLPGGQPVPAESQRQTGRLCSQTEQQRHGDPVFVISRRQPGQRQQQQRRRRLCDHRGSGRQRLRGGHDLDDGLSHRQCVQGVICGRMAGRLCHQGQSRRQRRVLHLSGRDRGRPGL
jgi:hypothetical protein